MQSLKKQYMIYGSINIHRHACLYPFVWSPQAQSSLDHFRISFQGTKVSLTTLVMLRLLLLKELVAMIVGMIVFPRFRFGRQLGLRWMAEATPGVLRRSTKMEASKKPSFNLIWSRIHSKVANQHVTWPSKVISRTCKPYLNSCKISAMLSLIDLISWCPGAQETNMAKSHTVTYSGILTSQINPFSIWQTLSLGTATHDALCSARLPSKGVAPWYSCRKRWIDSLLELQSKSLELTFVRGFKTHQFQLFYWKGGPLMFQAWLPWWPTAPFSIGASRHCKWRRSTETIGLLQNLFQGRDEDCPSFWTAFDDLYSKFQKGGNDLVKTWRKNIVFIHQPLGVWRDQIRLELPLCFWQLCSKHTLECIGECLRCTVPYVQEPVDSSGPFSRFSPTMGCVGNSWQTHSGTKIQWNFDNDRCTNLTTVASWLKDSRTALYKVSLHPSMVPYCRPKGMSQITTSTWR